MKKKIILILVLIYILMFGIKTSYSLYNDSQKGKIEPLSFAKIIFNNEELTELTLPIDNLLPGNSIDYQFKIANNKDGNRSEITIGYNVIIETYHLIPINIDLYTDDGTNTKILSCNEEEHQRNSQNKLVCSTEDNILPYNIDSTDNYKLTISFDETDKEGKPWSEEYIDLIDFIDIKINSWQVVE